METDKVCFIAKYSGHKCSIFFSKVLVILYFASCEFGCKKEWKLYKHLPTISIFKTKL